MGKLFIVIGVVFILVGLIVSFAPSIPFLGKLPGDIRYESGGMKFYFPIVTCIIISIILSLLLNLFGGWK